MDRAEKLALYEDLVAGSDDLAIKGKTMPYTAINGNMFSFLGQDDTLAFRLSDEDRAAFESEQGPSEVRQYGSVMRGYVGLPDELLADRERVAALFAASVAHARTLKPKPTKR